ncbi:hypothetical protein [Pantoea coffeiphila]|uniref:hypothetical protein n=1 Tax=Pantoea coffeiphila TaxID=1465635 RepID=UPI0019614BC7|nr:hypothetical protein [Pantoea coffeiphila]MBM7341417.1 hypothetical protein [Pantoea coffeiphila]
MSIAFGGSPQRKQQVLSQLENSWLSGKIHPHGAFWQGESGTFSGCAVRGGLDDYVSVTGLPASFALLADRLAFEDEAFDIHWAREWFTTLAAGQDLSGIEPALLSALLGTVQEQLEVCREEIAPPILDLLERLTALHRASPPLPGNAAPWQSLQQAVMDLPQSPDDSILNYYLIALLEALCWPLAESVTLFTELLSPLQGLNYHIAKIRCGWSDRWQQREQEINQRFEEALANHTANQAGEYSEEQLTTLRSDIVGQLIANNPDYFTLIGTIEKQIREDRAHLKAQFITLLAGHH